MDPDLAGSKNVSLPNLWSVIALESLCPVCDVFIDISEMFGPQENTSRLDTSAVPAWLWALRVVICAIMRAN